MVRQQNEMNEIRTLLNALRFQTETFPFLFIPITRMLNPFNNQRNDLNLDEMSYEVILF